jgi:hypothetical protein
MTRPATSEKLLQLTFRYEGPYEAMVGILARSLANAPGLIWKDWLVNEAEAEAGGVYLFSDAGALESYLRGPILSNIQYQDGVYDLSLKTFDTLNEIALVAFSPSLHDYRKQA